MLQQRLRRRWIIGLLIVAAVATATLALPAARLVHHLYKSQRVENYESLMAQHAAATNLPVELVRAVVMAESGGNPQALSPRQARGLMQITALTEQDVLERNADMKKGDLYDPDYNLRIGTTYLAYLLERFDGDQTLTLAAYHMGPSAVRKLQRAHPELTADQLVARHAGPQTKAYVQIVQNALR